MAIVEINIPVDYARLLVRVLESHESSSVRDLRRICDMVIDIQNKIDRIWNPDHDQNAWCQCGHIYSRHFDGYEDMAAVGCKYCECYTFESEQ
jgi:hypothetical protein